MRHRSLSGFSISVIVIICLCPALHSGWTLDGAPICTQMGVQDNPHVVPDGLGGAYIVWDDSRIWTDIYARRVDRDGNRLWTETGVAVCTAADKWALLSRTIPVKWYAGSSINLNLFPGRKIWLSMPCSAGGSVRYCS